MTGREVVELIKQNVGVPWREQSYRDTFKFGNRIRLSRASPPP